MGPMTLQKNLEGVYNNKLEKREENNFCFEVSLKILN